MANYRQLIGEFFIRGSGIEIGALHNPFPVPEKAKVRYVDRMSVADLRLQYPEMAGLDLVNVDIVDNGETLGTVPDASQDFLIASHFLEHAPNPILFIVNALRVLKDDGFLILIVPDKNFTQEIHRPATSFDHLLKEYKGTPEFSKEEHFREFTYHFNGLHDEESIRKYIDEYLPKDFSIHYHAWAQFDIMEFLVKLRTELTLPFEVELFAKSTTALFDGSEFAAVLKKTNALNEIVQLVEFSAKLDKMTPSPAETVKLRTLLGKSFFGLGKFFAARQQFMAAIAAGPGQADPMIELASLLLTANQAANAWEWVKKAEQVAPDHPELGSLKAQIPANLRV